MKDLFYKPLKINAREDDILFWGCIHMHHNPIHWEIPLWRQRGFESVEEHDWTLIENWNSRANKNTIGFLLGDTMFGKGGSEKFKKLLNSLTFNTLYICGGNHTAGFSSLLNEIDGNIYIFSKKTVVFCPNYFEAFINGKSVCLGHYPVLSFNGQSRGSYMLFAHVHNNLSKSEIGRLYLEKARCFEVSVDANKFPVTFKEIKNKLDNKNIISFDGHTSDTQNPF